MFKASIVFSISLVLLFGALFVAFDPGLLHAQGIDFTGDTGGVVPCEGINCDACHLVELTQNIINFAVYLTIFVATLMFVWAGFLYITAGGDSSKIKSAHDVFWKVLVGMVIVLAAWLIVDAIMKVLFNESGYNAPWNEILCRSENTGNNPGNPNAPGYFGRGGDDMGGDGGGGIDVGGEGPDSLYGFSFDPGINAQVGHQSQALDDLLRCMGTRLSGSGIGRISSISDSFISSGQKTFSQCALGGCRHVENSCHYGGRKCVGKSYAVDFGDEGNAVELSQAAKACNSGARSFFEGTHVHITIGEASGCECDANL